MKLWLSVGAFFLPVIASAQQLVPVACNDPRTCGSCELVSLINNVIQFVIQISVVIAAIILVYAGLIMVTSSGNPGQITRAKGLFFNVVIGLLILLAAFLIVNTILSALLRTGSPAFSWQTIECVYPGEARPLRDYVPTRVIDGGGAGGGAFSGAGGLITPGGRGEAQCAPENPNCSVDFLQSLGLTADQANVMSCVAVTENSGGAVGCSGTGPCGTFQITQTNWRNYTEGAGADYPECSAANLGGITAAQNNGPCNAKVMTSLVRDVGYQPWTGANTDPTDNVPDGPWNRYARGCVQTYSTAGDTTSRGF